MQPLDHAVIAAYLTGLTVIGVVIARRAGQSAEHYFLGGRSLPWWALGASGMASNLDVAGTMAIVALLHLYGLHGFFIELRGGVVLPLALFLAFMGRWHRRSAVMTTAEWMLLRFGDSAQGRAARVMAALTYLVITVAMTVFFFTAGGRFLAEFLPFSPLQCTLGMALVAFGYTLVGGLYGVVWTDVFQAGIIGSAAVYVSVVAAQEVSPELLAAWPGARFNTFVPSWEAPGLAPYAAFGWFLCVWAGKGLLEGLGGSAGSAYMAQRYYAARSDAECMKLGLLWTVLFAFRWPMALGFAVLAVRLGLPGDRLDAERVLPVVLQSEFFPAGVRGLLVAALLAAAMSTFDSTVNAGAAYLVNDLYSPWRPQAGRRELVWAGYAGSALIVGIGLAIALLAGASVLGVWVGIVMLLFPAFLVPFALRWYWARFNGAGFAAGIGTGFAAAVGCHLHAPAGWNEAQLFLAIAAVSLAGSVAATLVTAPVPTETLHRFYTRTAPFGWWPRRWREPHRRVHRADLTRMIAALGWQMLTFLLPMALLLGRWDAAAALAAPWTALLAFLLAEVRRASPALATTPSRS